MRFLLSIILASISVGCAHTSSGEQIALTPEVQMNAPNPEPTAEPTPKYPGISIAEVFPVIESSSLIDDNRRETEQTMQIEGFTLLVKNYVPISLDKVGSSPFKFKKFRETDGYWAFAAGISHLRGPNSKEIYTEIGGPGAVCCTNYSIIDISSDRPRTIFHSEDFGHFRDTMEIFDADGDGVYEIMQWDSCMRYFRDDCGSCSPEPRVYFKYRTDIGKYWPANGIMQDFVKENFDRTEQWIKEKSDEWRRTKDLSVQLELHRGVIAYVADLLHIGEERKAWATFERNAGVVDDADRREIEKRLADCKFHISLRSGK